MRLKDEKRTSQPIWVLNDNEITDIPVRGMEFKLIREVLNLSKGYEIIPTARTLNIRSFHKQAQHKRCV